MTDKGMDLTRRKILASMGAVGAAGAAAGFGTSALFTDNESFANNVISAGSLDLKVDWEEHYSYPQIYDSLDDPTIGADGELDVTRTEPDDPSQYTGLPDPQDPVVWVNDDDFDEYFQNTTIEAFPDAPGSPIEADFSEEPGGGQPCQVLADVPDDFGSYNDENLGRTRNADTYDAETDTALPLVNLTDVKPGDFGELTLSTHLCFNDGYLWLSMPGGVDESENGLEEPEEEVDDTPNSGELAENIQTALWYDDNCSNTIDGEPDPLIAMALIDASGSIDGDEMQTIADASNAFVQLLNQMSETNIAAGVMTYSGRDLETEDGRSPIILRNDVERLDADSTYLTDGFVPGESLLPESGAENSNSPLAPALDLARELLNDRAETLKNNSGNGFGPNTRKSILVLSDGLPTAPKRERYGLFNPDGTIVTPENGSGVTNDPDDNQFLSDIFDGAVDGNSYGVTESIRDEVALVARDADSSGKSDSGPDDSLDDPDISGSDGITLRTVGVGTENESTLNDFLTRIASEAGLFYNASLQGQELENVVNDIVRDLNVTGPAEEVLFRGTLAELATQLDPGQQGPLPLDGMRMSDDFDELGSAPDAGPSDGRDCFDASATHCFGLAWWVPIGVGNEIQGDSVGFDLQFLAEQCRNNDDPGQTVLGNNA